jgi:hypothetical protein
MPPAVRVGILAPGSVASYVVVVVVVAIPRPASTVPITTREQDERRSPSSPPPVPRSHRLRPTLPLRRPPRRLGAHGRRRRGRFGRVDRRQQQDHDGRGLHAAERSRECVCGRFFFGGGLVRAAAVPSNLIPPSPAPPHPTPKPIIYAFFSPSCYLSLSLRSRLLDDRNNPRRQPRQIRLQGGEPQGRGVPAEHR